jgi:type III pantothenate kinase
MILLLDVGNSQIFGGVIQKASVTTNTPPELILRFRKSTNSASSSDEIGLFLKNVLQENKIDPKQIIQIGICSVVPGTMHSLKGACQKYFNVTPFVLQAGVKTGLKIKYRNPLEVGADRIANSIAVTHLYPNQNVVVIDLGTATTFCAITKDKDYLGGAIIPGLKISMEALESRTAKLPTVEIVKPTEACGRSTIESIQSGLYFSHLGAMKELVSLYQKEVFNGEQPLVVGTGGFSRLFYESKIFNTEIPDLVLYGLYLALQMNQDQEKGA